MSNKIYYTIFSDCSIKINGVEIGVHKRTLATRSPVFFELLYNKSEETQNNIVEINDFSIEVVDAMLSYLYRDEVPNIENIASEVLAIAEKYELNGLKGLSENILCSSLAIENVCQRFALSERFGTKILKERCK
uniref:BTB domain-containing protein n=1 Tax=Strongyloides papillosus TaxID=174720 RepID=A0A0N5CE69_STREA